MKKVITEVDRNVVNIDDLNNKSIIGIEWRFNDKSFIVENKEGEFCGMNFKSLSLQGSWSAKSLHDYVTQAAEQNPEIYEFDNVVELYNWLLT